jgi:hypothetical protein
MIVEPLLKFLLDRVRIVSESYLPSDPNIADGQMPRLLNRQKCPGLMTWLDNPSSIRNQCVLARALHELSPFAGT